jgi:hypothetical protein
MRRTCGWLVVEMAVLLGCSRTSVDTVVTPERLACRELQPLADKPVLVPGPTYLTFFSADRSFLLLQLQGDPGRLVRVDLPSGAISTVADPIGSVTSLGGGKAFLLAGTGADRWETWLYDGNQTRPLYSGICHVAATPEGATLYAVGPCVGAENGLSRIDLATGTRIAIDRRVELAPKPDIRVSPNGQWIAYGITDPEDSHRTLAVADATGKVTSLTTERKVYLVDFASDQLMLFQTEGPPGTPGDIRGHVPGSGDTSFLIAADRAPGSDDGYVFSPDRSQIVMVKRPDPTDVNGPNSIYRLPLAGGDPVLLVANWSDPFGARPNPIFFDSQGQYVLYTTYERGDPATFPLAVVDLQGSPPRPLADDGGVILGTASSSALIIDDHPDGQPTQLRLTDLATGRDRLSYSSKAGVEPVAVLRNDQAFLFAEYEGERRRARFVSAKHSKSVLLGEWNQSRCRGCPELILQADPTGCFTVVNTDATSPPGTRLVLFPE